MMMRSSSAPFHRCCLGWQEIRRSSSDRSFSSLLSFEIWPLNKAVPSRKQEPNWFISDCCYGDFSTCPDRKWRCERSMVRRMKESEQGRVCGMWKASRATCLWVELSVFWAFEKFLCGNHNQSILISVNSVFLTEVIKHTTSGFKMLKEFFIGIEEINFQRFFMTRSILILQIPFLIVLY